jgi:hypothetical protein
LQQVQLPRRAVSARSGVLVGLFKIGTESSWRFVRVWNSDAVIQVSLASLRDLLEALRKVFETPELFYGLTSVQFAQSNEKPSKTQKARPHFCLFTTNLTLRKF